MNEKITLPALIQLLAIKTGDSRKQSEDFVKEFFNLITLALEDGDLVKIKSLGVFKTVTVGARKSVNVSTGEENEIPSHRKVVFSPSKEVAAMVNEPFEMFETVEVNPEVKLDYEDINDVEVEEQKQEQIAGQSIKDTLTNSTNILEEPIVVNHIDQDSIDPVSIETSAGDVETTQSKETLRDIPEIVTEENSSQKSATQTEVTIDKSGSDNGFDLMTEPQIKSKRFGFGFIVGFLSALVICGIAFLVVFYCFDQKIIVQKVDTKNVAVNTDIPKVNKDIVTDTIAIQNETKTEKEESTDDINNINGSTVPTAPSDEIIYDMITKTRYLTTMAKDHYGNYNLWPYIYMENQKFLGHPDRIKPGTRIVIPSLSKYGVDPTNKSDIEKAKKKGIEIYSKYK